MRFFDGENWRNISEDEARYRIQEGQEHLLELDTKLAPVMLVIDDDAAEVAPINAAPAAPPTLASAATPASALEPTTEPKPKRKS